MLVDNTLLPSAGDGHDSEGGGYGFLVNNEQFVETLAAHPIHPELFDFPNNKPVYCKK
jgi:hypothetical protein